MTWQPISVDEFRGLLREHVARLDELSKRLWDRYAIEPTQVPCVRRTWDGSPAKTESMYGVARSGDRVVIYDDVEEEFGTGVLDTDRVLRRWSTNGELRWALTSFGHEIDAKVSRTAG